MWVFDLDGTLVDTRRAVEASYAAVGVAVPVDFWGRPWQEWLHDAQRHDEKNRVYPSMLALYARPLPLLDRCLATGAPVLTGASYRAVAAVKEALCPGLNVVLCGASVARKQCWLQTHGTGVYVDDLPFPYTPGWDVLSPEEALCHAV